MLRVITKFLRTTRKQLRSNAYSNLATVAGARGGSILAALLSVCRACGSAMAVDLGVWTREGSARPEGAGGDRVVDAQGRTAN